VFIPELRPQRTDPELKERKGEPQNHAQGAKIPLRAMERKKEPFWNTPTTQAMNLEQKKKKGGGGGEKKFHETRAKGMKE